MYAPTSHWSRPTNAAEQNDPQSSSDTFPPKHFQHSQGQDTAGKERSSSESDPQMDAFAPGATTYSGDVLDSIENYGPPKSPEQSASEDYAISRSERRPSDRYAADNNSHYDPATSQTEFERFVDEKVKKRMNLQSSSWNSVIPQIKELVQLSKNTLNAELEVHIGRIDKNSKRFRSGVSLAWFESLLKKMEGFTGWEQRTREWERIEELIFERDVRIRRSHPDGCATFLKKQLVKGIDLSMGDAKYDIRLVLKSENDCHQNYGIPEFLRFKERKWFRHKNFSYFFTKVWEGRDLSSVRRCRAKYEIEVECVDVSADVNYLTKSMILKCTDLIGKVGRSSERPEEPVVSRSGAKMDENFFRGVTDLCKQLVPQYPAYPPMYQQPETYAYQQYPQYPQYPQYSQYPSQPQQSQHPPYPQQSQQAPPQMLPYQYQQDPLVHSRSIQDARYAEYRTWGAQPYDPSVYTANSAAFPAQSHRTNS